MCHRAMVNEFFASLLDILTLFKYYRYLDHFILLK